MSLLEFRWSYATQCQMYRALTASSNPTPMQHPSLKAYLKIIVVILLCQCITAVTTMLFGSKLHSLYNSCHTHSCCHLTVITTSPLLLRLSSPTNLCSTYTHLQHSIQGPHKANHCYHNRARLNSRTVLLFNA